MMEEFACWIADEYEATKASGPAFLESHGIENAEVALAILKLRSGERERITAFWQSQFNKMADKYYIHPLRSHLDAAPSLPESFPDYSCVLTISFTLARPFFSRADGEFHVHDNAICRERILHLPMIKPSTWKGNLRAAAYLLDSIADPVRLDLFGNEQREQEHFRRGRLFFFPSFFQKVDIEVITPLERRTRTPKKGRGALPVEVVPRGEHGNFYLLYSPPWIGSEEERSKKIRDEYEAIPQILKGALRTYGFSAKKADGWGCIKEPFRDGTVKIKRETVQEKPFKTFAELTNIFTQLRPQTRE